MNNFHFYNKTQQIYNDIIQHSEKSDILLTQTLNDLKVTEDLELVHLLLKHARSCTDQCSINTYTSFIANFIESELKEYLKKNEINSIPYPLLVCMLDLLKNNVEVNHELYAMIGCRLWNHNQIYMCRKSMELCTYLLSCDVILSAIMDYIKLAEDWITQEDLNRFRSIEYTEFFFQPTVNTQHFRFDRVTLKLSIQLVLLTLSRQDLDPTFLNALKSKFKTLHARHDETDIKEILFDIYCVNDDDTIHLLNTLLSIDQTDKNSILNEIQLDPHSAFLYFIYRCGNTHDILIDLLLENDSEFLSYFHRYVIYATHQIDCFRQAIERLGEDKIDLDRVQTIFANIILVLEGDGLPYNTKPLVKRLLKFEEQLYI